MLLVLLVLSYVNVAVRVHFISLSLLLIIVVAPFVYSPVAVKRYSSSVLPMLDCLSKVDSMLVLH